MVCMDMPLRAVAEVSEDARSFARLARHLSEFADKSTAGQAIAEAAVAVIDCTSAALVHLETGNGLKYQIPGAGPDHYIHTIAAIVGRVGEGPALDAVRTGEPVTSADLTVEERWPAYAAGVVAQTPLRSLLVFPLHLDGTTYGVLCLYDERPGFFTEAVADAAWVFAEHATIALARVGEAQKLRSLETALASSRVIGQAIGILMARYKVREQDAFDLVRLASQASHRKVRDLAADIVRQGDLPV